MGQSDQPEEDVRSDVLDAPDAGAKVIRGGAVRSGGFAAGRLLVLLSAPLLVRHLGVVDFGGYAAVLSLIGIAAILSEGGLTAVGVREYSVRDEQGRDRLIRALLTLRLVMSLGGALAGVAIAVFAGYSESLVVGAALGGLGLVLLALQQAYTVPLAAELRFGAIAALDFLRQFLTATGIIVLVVVGASVTAFLALSIPVGIVVGAVTLYALRGHLTLGGRTNLAELLQVAREAFAVAGATILAALFYRFAVVMMSVLSTGLETGYFAASQRVIEALLPFVALVNSATFPVLSRAADTASTRLRGGLQRVFEVNVVLAGWTALMLVLGAEPIIAFLGGSEFEPAVPVLQIQAVAIAATFLSAAWGTALIAVRAERALFSATAVGVGVGVSLTAILAPSDGAHGAALAVTIGEVVRALATGLALVWVRPELRPRLTIGPKLLVALGLAALLGVTGISPLLACALATAIYFGLLAFTGALPSELWGAFRAIGRGWLPGRGGGR
jgi:O-antigen/teichoic acid export membrane protein